MMQSHTDPLRSDEEQAPVEDFDIAYQRRILILSIVGLGVILTVVKIFLGMQ
ncbi:MAG: hypothetical protein OQK24_02625 [Magnetovibrio sp.]|nr:hypothetical protein [Magnetovibrio sp.]